MTFKSAGPRAHYSHWNYRVVERALDDGTLEHSIQEAYYNEGGEVVAIGSADATTDEDDPRDALAEILGDMVTATTKPIVRWDLEAGCFVEVPDA